MDWLVLEYGTMGWSAFHKDGMQVTTCVRKLTLKDLGPIKNTDYVVLDCHTEMLPGDVHVLLRRLLNARGCTEDLERLEEAFRQFGAIPWRSQ